MSKSKDSDSFEAFGFLEKQVETTGVNVFNGGGSTIDSGDDLNIQHRIFTINTKIMILPLPLQLILPVEEDSMALDRWS